MSATKWILSAFLVCAASGLASEGDFLIDVGPQAVGRTYTGYQSPMLGGSVALLKGFNDRTDIGVMAAFDFAKKDTRPSNQTWTTLGIQSWYTAFNGDIRPQIGGAVGLTVDGDGNALFHLSGRMRGLMELSTNFRLYAGGSAGADIGDYGGMFVKGEFGAQFLIR